MLERQDIDALLISALYGELSPADESRLTTHLETHPADKSALAALTSTREAFRKSRLFDIQLEPPQSVSALLLQEAHRRAPKASEKEGWFARLARSFMAHPAMAAAAMLVIVLGIAAIVRNRNGDEVGQQYAEDTKAMAPAAGSAAAAQPHAADTPSLEQDERGRDLQEKNIASGSGSAFGAGSDAYRVGLADDGKALRDGDKLAKQDQATPATATVATTAAAKPEQQQVAKGKDSIAADPKKAVTKATGGIELRRADPTPKDLDAEDDGVATRDYNKETVNAVTPATGASGPSGGGMGGGGSVSQGALGAGGRGESNTGYAIPPPASNAPADNRKNQNDARVTTAPAAPGAAPSPTPTPAPVRTAPQQPRNGTPAPPPPPPPLAKAEKAAETPKSPPKAAAPAEDKAPNDPQLAWARQLHESIVAKVSANDCAGAAQVALKLSNGDRAYYETNVANDRRVKGCIAYITAQREKEQSERAEKLRAAQKRSNEPAPAAIDSTK